MFRMKIATLLHSNCASFKAIKRYKIMKEESVIEKKKTQMKAYARIKSFFFLSRQ